MGATMIDKGLADKPLNFEISLGNAGNTIDGGKQPVASPRFFAAKETDSGK